MRTKNKYYIAVDFDGTLVENKFPIIGDIKSKTIQALQKRITGIHAICECEIVIILWTCRAGEYLEDAKEWCKNNLPKELMPKYYNENPERYHESPKVVADEYWDDRNVLID